MHNLSSSSDPLDIKNYLDNFDSLFIYLISNGNWITTAALPKNNFIFAGRSTDKDNHHQMIITILKRIRARPRKISNLLWNRMPAALKNWEWEEGEGEEEEVRNIPEVEIF